MAPATTKTGVKNPVDTAAHTSSTTFVGQMSPTTAKTAEGTNTNNVPILTVAVQFAINFPGTKFPTTVNHVKAGTKRNAQTPTVEEPLEFTPLGQMFQNSAKSVMDGQKKIVKTDVVIRLDTGLIGIISLISAKVARKTGPVDQIKILNV